MDWKTAVVINLRKSFTWMDAVFEVPSRQAQDAEPSPRNVWNYSSAQLVFPSEKKGGVIISVWWWQLQNWITEEKEGQAKFNVFKCMFSIKSQSWVENFKPGLLISCVYFRKDWVRKKLCKEKVNLDQLVLAAGFQQFLIITFEGSMVNIVVLRSEEGKRWLVEKERKCIRVCNNKMLMG